MTTERIPGFDEAMVESVLERRERVLASVEPDVRAWFMRTLELHAAGGTMAFGEACFTCGLLVPATARGVGLCQCEPARERLEEWMQIHGVGGLLPLMMSKRSVNPAAIASVA